MAAPTLIQAPTGQDTTNGTSYVLTGTVGSWNVAVTAGSTLICVIHDTGSAIRTYSVSDDVDGAWTGLTQAQAPSGRSAKLSYTTGHTGGTVTVTVSSNFNSVKRVQLLEISDSTFDVESTISSASTGVDASLGYPCSADGTVIDTAADVFIVSAVTLDAAGNPTGGAGGYTALYGGTQWRSQYLRSASALTNERGWIAEAGTDRSFAGVIASWAAAGGGGGGTTPKGVFGKALYGPLRRVVM